MVVTRSLVLERLSLTKLEQNLISTVFPLVIIYGIIPCSSSTTGSNMLGFCQGYQGARQGGILSLDRTLSRRGVRQGKDADEVERSSTLVETEEIQSVPAAEREREKRRKRKRQEDAGKRLEEWRHNTITASAEDIEGGGRQERIWTIGGRIREISIFGSNRVQCWNAQEGHWEDIKPLALPRINCAAAVLDSKMYVTGGWHTTLTAMSSNECLSVGTTLDENSVRWESAPKMAKNRSAHSMAVLGGYLYAAGGWDEQARVRRSVERWKPGMETWEKCASMRDRRFHFGLAALSGRLVAAGGKDNDGCMLDSCEVYDSKFDRWDVMPCRMSLRRMAFPLISLRGKLYAVAGFDQQGHFHAQPENLVDLKKGRPKGSGWYAQTQSPAFPLSPKSGIVDTQRREAVNESYGIDDVLMIQKDLKEPFVGASVDVYDPAAGEWSLLSGDLIHARGELGGCAVNGTLYAMGGLDDAGDQPDMPHELNMTKRMELPPLRDPTYQCTVERYNFISSKWELVPEMEMHEGRGDFACLCVAEV